MGFFLVAAVWAGIYLVNLAVQWAENGPPKRPTWTPQTQNLPRSDEGTPVPIVFGRVRIQSPILAWTSSLKSQVVIDPSGTGFYTYGLDMLFVAGIPMGNGVTQGNRNAINAPRLYNVWYGDQLLNAPVNGWIPNLVGNYSAQRVVMPDLLGGLGSGGGVTGTYEFFGGYTDQDLGVITPGFRKIGDAILADGTADPTLFPSYRRQMLVALTDTFGELASYASHEGPTVAVADVATRPPNWTLGESASVSGISFEVAAWGDMLFSMTLPGVDFGGDADPAEAAYDLLTNPWARLGIDKAKINTASFAAASAILKTENHGYSAVIYNATSGTQALSDILRQTDGVIYEEPTDGTLVFSLIRAPTGVLPIFNESNCVVDDFGLGDWPGAATDVRLTWTDRSNNYQVGIVIAQSIATADGNSNRRRVVQLDMPGITNAQLAAQVAARELNVLSRPLSKVTMEATRDASALRPGSCFRLSWSEYNIVDTVFRCTRVDLGQLFSNKVTIEAVEDVFGLASTGAVTVFGSAATMPWPVSYRVFVESPRMMQRIAAANGLITTEDKQHVLGFGVPDDASQQFSVKTRALLPPVVGAFAVDVAQYPIPMNGRLIGSYAREAEPYDTSGSLIIGALANVPSGFILTSGFTPATIAAGQAELIWIDGEIIAYETATDNGNGTYTLSGVWRGMFDTSPLAHAAGARAVWIDARFVGARAWLTSPNGSREIGGEVVPRRQTSGIVYNGSGEEDLDVVISVGRIIAPLRVTDLCVGGEGSIGTLGSPAVAGEFKRVASFEDGMSVWGRRRDLPINAIARGDATEDPPSQTGVNYVISATKVGGTAIQLASFGSTFIAGGQCYLLGGAGHGEIDITAKTTRIVPAGDATGLTAGTILSAATTPAVRVTAPRWRQLLGNPRWTYTDGSGYGPSWINGANTDYLNTAAFTANGQVGVVVASSGAAADSTFAQVIDVSGFVPHGLAAVLDYYDIAQSATGTPRVDVTVTPLDSGGATLSGAQTLTSSPSTTSCQRRTVPAVSLPVGTSKIKVTVRLYSNDGYSTPGVQASLDLGTALGMLGAGPRIYATNAGTAGNSITFTLAAVGYDGVTGNFTSSSGNDVTYNVRHATSEAAAQTDMVSSLVYATQISSNNLSNDFTGGPFSLTGGVNGVGGSPQSVATEFRLRVGQQLHDLLANGNFDAAMTSWTVDLGAFSAGVTTNARPSSGYAQGGAAAISIAHQEYTPATGWEVGTTAVLTFWRMNVLAKDPGKVTLEWRDSGGSVLATVDTTRETMPTLNVWYARTLSLDVPAGATKLRVTIQAERSLTSGNSGACFDDMVLDIHKQLDATFTRTLDFSAPRPQPMPTTWQEHHLTMPGVLDPPIAFGGRSPVGAGPSGVPTIFSWTDGGAHDPAKLVGTFGLQRLVGAISAAHLTSVDGYRFARDGIHMVAASIDPGNYKSADSFTAVVFFQLEELPWSGSSCGLVGRLDSTGWSLSINAGGSVVATLFGSSIVVAQRPTTVVDGALHMAAIVYDGVARQLISYDERGGASTSAIPAGEFGSMTALMRLGVDKASGDPLPGVIARAFIWGRALSSTEIAAQWSYGADPTGLLDPSSRSVEAYVDGYPDSAGATLVLHAADQLAIGYSTALATHGLALAASHQNLVPTWDATAWTIDAGATITAGVLDPTGRMMNRSGGRTLAGVTVTVDGTNGVSFSITMAASGKVRAQIYGRGSGLVVFELLNGSGVAVSSATVPLSSTTWTKTQGTMTWGGGAGSGRIRIRSTSAMTLDLASVVWVGLNVDFPALIVGPLASTTDVAVSRSETCPAQMNAEGEIKITGAATTVLAAASALATISNLVNTNDRRDLTIDASGRARLDHYDASGVDVSSVGTAIDWTQVWTVRGRWCSLGLPETASGFAGVVTAGSVLSSTYGRGSTWTYGSTKVQRLVIGGVTPASAWISSVTFRSREEKLA